MKVSKSNRLFEVFPGKQGGSPAACSGLSRERLCKVRNKDVSHLDIDADPIEFAFHRARYRDLNEIVIETALHDVPSVAAEPLGVECG